MIQSRIYTARNEHIIHADVREIPKSMFALQGNKIVSSGMCLLACLFMQACRYVCIRDIYYLAQKLCFWTGIIFIGVYVSVCVSVCVCVCVSVSLYIDYLKKLLTDFDKTWQDDV